MPLLYTFFPRGEKRAEGPCPAGAGPRGTPGEKNEDVLSPEEAPEKRHPGRMRLNRLTDFPTEMSFSAFFREKGGLNGGFPKGRGAGI